MKFSIHQATSVGGRPVNEDRVGYAYSREALLMVLSDGMGGHAAGEVAAQIALQSLIQAFRLSAKPRVEDPLSFLSQAIINAHYAILEYARVNHIEGNPRATVVTCLVQEGGYAWWAHVGDSRLYHIRRGKVLTRTIDHSHAQLLIEQGVLSEAQLRTHDSRNRLYCSLGGETLPHVDFGRRAVLQAGDVIALCSDGLWGVLDDEEIAERLARGPLMKVVPELVEQAEMEAGPSSDNVSLIAMRWEEGEPALAPDTVSTETMALDQVTTAFSLPQQPPGFSAEPLDNEEIERAIREINETIQKFKG